MPSKLVTEVSISTWRDEEEGVAEELEVVAGKEDGKLELLEMVGADSEARHDEKVSLSREREERRGGGGTSITPSSIWTKVAMVGREAGLDWTHQSAIRTTRSRLGKGTLPLRRGSSNWKRSS